MKVCCIIVTYGERFKFLAQVAERLLSMGTDQLVIIDNGSPPSNRLQVEALATKYSTRIITDRFEENEGSAIGFRKGLALAEKSDCEFVWILDDDNLPEPDALEALRRFWNNKASYEEGRPVVALSSMRADREVFVRAVEERKPEAFLWPVNSFSGFHLRELFQKLKERIKPAGNKKVAATWEPLKLSVGFYGGLFFPVSLLQKTGLPNERMVLYADDLLFTQTISSKVGDIWLVPDSVVRDIDMPFYIRAKKGFLYHSSLDGGKDALVYYAMRNAVYYIRKFLVTNAFVFYINKLCFLGFVTLAGLLRGKVARLRLIYAAIRDGEQERLGKSNKYKL